MSVATEEVCMWSREGEEEEEEAWRLSPRRWEAREEEDESGR